MNDLMRKTKARDGLMIPSVWLEQEETNWKLYIAKRLWKIDKYVGR